MSCSICWIRSCTVGGGGAGNAVISRGPCEEAAGCRPGGGEGDATRRRLTSSAAADPAELSLGGWRARRAAAASASSRRSSSSEIGGGVGAPGDETEERAGLDDEMGEMPSRKRPGGPGISSLIGAGSAAGSAPEWADGRRGELPAAASGASAAAGSSAGASVAVPRTPGSGSRGGGGGTGSVRCPAPASSQGTGPSRWSSGGGPSRWTSTALPGRRPRACNIRSERSGSPRSCAPTASACDAGRSCSELHSHKRPRTPTQTEWPRCNATAPGPVQRPGREPMPRRQTYTHWPGVY
eukprot:6875209-Alexandrium_andersonii.AAC.2